MSQGDVAARRCHCGREVVPRDPDPWEGRMDDFCEDCALNRCDCYPDVCPVKYSADRAAASALDWLALGYAVSVRWFICIPAMERRPLYGRARRVLKHPMFRRFVARA